MNCDIRDSTVFMALSPVTTITNKRINNSLMDFPDPNSVQNKIYKNIFKSESRSADNSIDAGYSNNSLSSSSYMNNSIKSTSSPLSRSSEYSSPSQNAKEANNLSPEFNNSDDNNSTSDLYRLEQPEIPKEVHQSLFDSISGKHGNYSR